MAQELNRTTFETSRLLEFFSEKELSMQIGHGRGLWPIALVKELIDNALDACETAKVPPAIAVAVGRNDVTVSDNGPGLPAEKIARSLDYAVRVSDKNKYSAPTRGQLGNALKTVWAAPFVADGQRGRVDVQVDDTVHTIDVQVDHIAQAPQITRTTQKADFVKSGTSVRMHWSGVASYLDGTRNGYFYIPPVSEIVRRYALMNPHATFDLVDENGGRRTFPVRSQDWTKWTPSTPTSPHWYDPGRLRDLIAAYIHAGQGDRSVRDFVSEFRGLAGSRNQKQVVDAAGLDRQRLSDLVIDGDVDPEVVGRLLASMQTVSRPVQASALGQIGKDHVAHCLTAYYGVVPESVQYVAKRGNLTFTGDDGGTWGTIPYCLEVATGIKDQDDAGRDVVVGLNWTPTLVTPIQNLDHYLGENRVDGWDPVVVFVHLSCPILAFTDRGKSRLFLPDGVLSELEGAITTTTKHWKRIKRQADQDDRVRARELDELRRQRNRDKLSIKDACYLVMVDAYNEASANGLYPANARQIMYAARRRVLPLTGGEWYKNSANFTQDVLQQFVQDNPDLTDDWDVAFDDRGHLIEPHTEQEVGVGTVNVRRYVNGWTNGHIPDLGVPSVPLAVDTSGPSNRFSAVLFIEKEGFHHILRASRLAERYDVAILSTKGQTVTAARKLAEDFAREGVRIFVLHDFDKSGLEIVNAYRTGGRRYDYDVEPEIIDIGLRLEDVLSWNLADDREEVSYNSKKDPRDNLRDCGATDDELDFLVARGRPGAWVGERVELNAMPSDVFVRFVETKLDDHGVRKVIPSSDLLVDAFRRAYRAALLQAEIDKVFAKIADQDVDVPDDLAAKVQDRLGGSVVPWDVVVGQIAKVQATADKGAGG